VRRHEVDLPVYFGLSKREVREAFRALIEINGKSSTTYWSISEFRSQDELCTFDLFNRLYVAFRREDLRNGFSIGSNSGIRFASQNVQLIIRVFGSNVLETEA
jgi:hypothetical protein